jgi:Mg2+/Co2+ transporter CorB
MNKNVNWIYKVFLLSFLLSAVFSSITGLINEDLNPVILIIILIIFISIGIIFDMIGVAVLTSKEATFHAKASKKIKGAKESIFLIKNNTKVSSICNDVVGDVCGIVSGTLGALLIVNICNTFDLNVTITTIIVTSIISALTIGFKAVGKIVATKKSDNITFMVGKIFYFLKIRK